MTTTSIKGVNPVIPAVTGNFAAGQPASGTGFKSVWEDQTGKGVESAEPSKQTQNRQEQDRIRQSDLREQDGENKPSKAREETQTTKTGKARKRVEEAQTGEEQPGENRDVSLSQEAMEILSSAAVQMLEQTAQILGVDVQELEATMAELGMTTTDLMNPAGLGEVILALGGARDSMELLTNEELYGDYKMLMAYQEQLIRTTAEQMDVSPGQLGDVVEDIRSLQQTTEEPVITVEDLRPGEVESTTTGQDNPVALTQDAESVGEIPENSQNAREGSENGSRQERGTQSGQDGAIFAHRFENPTVHGETAEGVSNVPGGTWDTDTQDIMRQIMDYMRIRLNSDSSDLEMQLHPASLGTLQIHVASKGGVVTANFVAQNETVKAALESQLVQLKESFAQQGVKVEAVEVTVQTHQFEQNLEQGRERQQGDPRKKNRTRRIDLNSLSDIGGGLDTDEQLTAQMMAANGQTVDYTA